MTVYVDDAKNPFGRMKMCHMGADNEEELHRMAEDIGIKRIWFQGDHYDICQEKRAMAIELGAVEVTSKELVTLIRKGR